MLLSLLFACSYFEKANFFPARKVFEAMAISEQLLEILVCPACRAKVELKADGSGLKCVECKRVYPIRDDIPVMLIDEAKIEDEQPAGNN